MSTTCPTCNHSVRKDARYCGFCGTNLTTPQAVKPALASASAGKTASNQTIYLQKPAKSKRFQTSQVVTFVAILLLILVIILAVVCRYWAQISQGLLQFLFSAYVRLLSL
jgi:uncharacterized integral membrane protein